MSDQPSKNWSAIPGLPGHSFRIGAATTAATVGIEDSTIQMLGRWSSAFLAHISHPQNNSPNQQSLLWQTRNHRNYLYHDNPQKVMQ